MKVLRNIEQEVEQFEIGDQIALHLESIGDFTVLIAWKDWDTRMYQK